MRLDPSRPSTATRLGLLQWHLERSRRRRQPCLRRQRQRRILTRIRIPSRTVDHKLLPSLPRILFIRCIMVLQVLLPRAQVALERQLALWATRSRTVLRKVPASNKHQELRMVLIRGICRNITTLWQLESGSPMGIVDMGLTLPESASFRYLRRKA